MPSVEKGQGGERGGAYNSGGIWNRKAIIPAVPITIFVEYITGMSETGNRTNRTLHGCM